jgi:ABC-2 type transport system permease protein
LNPNSKTVRYWHWRKGSVRGFDYVFPLDSMPVFFWWVAQLIPTTWLVDASRGVILRGAGWKELWPHAAVLWSMAIAMLLFSSMKVWKRLT